MEKKRKFIPALKYRFLTPVFDAVLALTIPERKFKETLIEMADIKPGHRVLAEPALTVYLNVVKYVRVGLGAG